MAVVRVLYETEIMGLSAHSRAAVAKGGKHDTREPEV